MISVIFLCRTSSSSSSATNSRSSRGWVPCVSHGSNARSRSLASDESKLLAIATDMPGTGNVLHPLCATSGVPADFRLAHASSQVLVMPLSPGSQLFHDIPAFSLVHPTTPSYSSAAAFLAQSCSSSCCASARTRSSLSSKARMNGSTAPGGAVCAQASRARSRTRTFGELSFWTISSGTTKPSTGCSGPEDTTDTGWELSPPGTVPIPDVEPVPLTEAMGTGLSAWMAGVDELLLDDHGFDDAAGPLALARDSRFGALSDEAGPQPASPARTTRLRSNLRRGSSRFGYGCDGGMSSGLSGGEAIWSIRLAW